MSKVILSAFAFAVLATSSPSALALDVFAEQYRIIFSDTITLTGTTPLEVCQKWSDEFDTTQEPHGTNVTLESVTYVAIIGTSNNNECKARFTSVDTGESFFGTKLYDSLSCPEGFQHPFANSTFCNDRCPFDQRNMGTLSNPICPGSAKNNGPQCGSVGNPCFPGSGNKFQIEVDYSGGGPFPLRLRRYYNLHASDSLAPGAGWWSHEYQRRVVGINVPPTAVRAFRHDGRVLGFSLTSGAWQSDGDISDRLFSLTDSTGKFAGLRLITAADEEVETYDLTGKLVSIQSRSGLLLTLEYTDGSSIEPNGGVAENTNVPLPAGLLRRARDTFGRQLVFDYDAANRIVRVTDAGGETYRYTYDIDGHLDSVMYPDTSTRRYLYEFVQGALTGLLDENGVRFATWSYSSDGKVIESFHGSNVDRYGLSYVPFQPTTVTDPFGNSRTYSFQSIFGVFRNTSISGPACPSCGPTSQTYDTRGNATSRTDWNGNRTNYSYDPARNLETSRTEGLTPAGGTTPETRTISTQWDAAFRLPTAVAEPLRITTNVYDPDGTLCGARASLCSRSIQATTDANGSQGFSATPAGTPRTWAYTYNANGSMLTMDGPRTDVVDVTIYTYYANDDPEVGKRGNVASMTNAAGHVTSITAYDAHGQPLTIVDANALTTTLTYDPRQRLTSRTVGTETTSHEYDGVGQLTKVTLPDGSFLTYSYDAAHRLSGIEDNLGNRIAYTLDAMGNRTQEEVRDPANALAQTRSRVFNNLNRLFQELGAAAQVTEYAYDNQGNVTSVKDPLNKVTANAYDALNRLRQVTDPALGVTQYAYNGLDALTQVTDPRNLVTGYTVDGLGNLTLQQSPDTGNTANTYDPAGNLLTQTDAKGQTTSYAYDVLSRVTLITFHDGSKQAYAYDQGANGLGRLGSVTETDPANQVTNVIAYAYDAHRRVTSETRTVNAVQYVLAYRYDSAGRLDQLTYPSGRTVNYAFDSLGRVSAVTTTPAGGQPQAVVSSVAYHPFGGVTGYTLGNGQLYSRSIDQDGRIASYTLGAQSFSIGYDAASRIEFIAELGNPANANTYGYDSLDRLTQAILPFVNYAYSYDAVGNRSTKTAGAGTDTYAYSATSNRLASITPSSGPIRSFSFDLNGSTLADGLNTYAYDARGRMVQATSTLGATNYQVNALGQRIRKTNSLVDAVFHYDTRGRLVAETNSAGILKREILYLGDIPVAVVQ